MREGLEAFAGVWLAVEVMQEGGELEVESRPLVMARDAIGSGVQFLHRCKGHGGVPAQARHDGGHGVLDVRCRHAPAHQPPGGRGVAVQNLSRQQQSPG